MARIGHNIRGRQGRGVATIRSMTIELDLGVRRFEGDAELEGTTFGRTMQQLVETDPSALAVTCGDESLSRAELFVRAYDLGLRLVAAGVRQGDYVSTVMHNSCDAIVAVFATWFAGAVPQVLSPKLAVRELDEILELTCPVA